MSTACLEDTTISAGSGKHSTPQNSQEPQNKV